MYEEYEPPIQNFEIYVSPWKIVGWAVLGVGAALGLIAALGAGEKRR